jgi:hypothetical protein
MQTQRSREPAQFPHSFRLDMPSPELQRLKASLILGDTLYLGRTDSQNTASPERDVAVIFYDWDYELAEVFAFSMLWIAKEDIVFRGQSVMELGRVTPATTAIMETLHAGESCYLIPETHSPARGFYTLVRRPQ